MADKPANGASAEAPAKSRHRSPNYPSIGLRAAVTKIQSVYKDGGLAPLMKLTALKSMGLSKDDANAAREIAALKSFGLIEELENDRLKLTQRGVDIVARQDGEPQRSAALRAAAYGPQIYRTLLSEYADTGIPPDAALKSELIAVKRFNPNVVGDFIKDFRDTLDFSGLSDLSVLELPEEEADGGDSSAKPGVPITQLAPETKPQLARLNPSSQNQNMREDVFSLTEGKVTIQWPTPLSAASVQDLKDWLKIVERKISRPLTTVIVVRTPNSYMLVVPEGSRVQSAPTENYETWEKLVERLKALGMESSYIASIEDQLKRNDTAFAAL